MKKKPVLVLALTISVIMAFIVILSGCSSKGGESSSATSAATSAATSTATPAPSNAPASASSSTAPVSALPTAEPLKKETISMFYTAGSDVIPDDLAKQGVTVADNPFINIVRDYANVDFKMDVPSAQDYQTKLHLLLASGNLPDIVFNHYNLDSDKTGDDGGFIDLKKYYDNSPVIQTIISPSMMEKAKSESGHYYRLPMAWNRGIIGMGTIVRYDLLEKYNNGKWPESVDEWVNVLKAIKQAEPNSTPLSGYNGTSFELWTVFNWFGVTTTGNRIHNDTYVADFTLPEYRAAIELLRQLYADKILDPQFATNTYDQFIANRDNKDVLFTFNTTNQVLPMALQYQKEHPTYKLAVAPPLKTYPSVLADPKFAQPTVTPDILGYGFYISSSAKDPDRAWKVIEGFAQQKLWDAMFWGEEGKQYNVVNGQKVPIADAITSDEFTWGQQYAMVYGYNSGEDIKRAVASQTLGSDYMDLLSSTLDANEENAKAHGIDNSYFEPVYKDPDFSDANKKIMNDFTKFIMQVDYEAIMGKITMDQFDQKVAEFKQKYGPAYDESTKWIVANKDELRNEGVLQVDW